MIREEYTVNKSRGRKLELVRDPFGIQAHAHPSTAVQDESASSTPGDSRVNPLWMITVALAVLVVIFIAMS